MSAIETGERLWDEAYKILDARNGMDAVVWEATARHKAGEVQQFLYDFGDQVEAVRPDIIAELGKAYDYLARGASETLYAIMPSPLARGVTSLVTGEATGQVLGDAYKAVKREVGEAAKGAKWYVKAGLIALGLAVAGLVAWKVKK